MPTLRPIADRDVEDVLALNHRNVVARAARRRGSTCCAEWADRIDVVDVDGRSAAS